MSDLSTAAFKKLGIVNTDGTPQKPVPYNPLRGKQKRKIDKDKTIGGRTEIAKRQQQKKGIPKSYWNNQEKQAQSFTDTSGMNRNKPKAEDDSNAIYYDKLTKKRKTIPGSDAKRTDVQISYPSYGD